jgi:peptidoglycan hydrolase CwlO-like protein
MPRPLARIVLAAALAGVLALGGVTVAAGDPGVGDLRSQARGARDREQSLQGSIGRLDVLVGRLERQLSALRQRQAEVQAGLDADTMGLTRLRGDLRAERARLRRLRARLEEGRRVLAARLLSVYKSPQPDLVTVALTSGSFADLLERATFLQRVHDQDARVLAFVKRARGDARAGVDRLAASESRQAQLVAAVQVRRDALASMGAALGERRVTLAQARSARAEALHATRANRVRVEARIRAVEREQARATARAAREAAASAGQSSGGPWSIPWPIVQCESGGQNLPPNSAGASGFYQIMPGTWQLYGGRGPAAHLAPKAEQDRVAARIWDGGRGASQWVCAALVG